jgi:hypothetical protein
VLARQWREALAANTMGAAAARQAEEARHRATEQEVRSAQSAWQRLGPLDPAERKPLQDRFDRACRRFFEQKRRHMAAPDTADSSSRFAEGRPAAGVRRSRADLGPRAAVGGLIADGRLPAEPARGPAGPLSRRGRASAAKRRPHSALGSSR